MLYRLISVGKIKENFYRQGVEEYAKRLTLYTPFELRDGLEEKYPEKASPARIQTCVEKEGKRIIDIVGSDYLLLLDVKGRMLSSEELAVRQAGWNQKGVKRLNIVVGGAYGVSAGVRERADETISLSLMTFPHQMAVLIIVEQFYRAQSIIHGGKYHHG